MAPLIWLGRKGWSGAVALLQPSSECFMNQTGMSPVEWLYGRRLVTPPKLHGSHIYQISQACCSLLKYRVPCGYSKRPILYPVYPTILSILYTIGIVAITIDLQIAVRLGMWTKGLNKNMKITIKQRAWKRTNVRSYMKILRKLCTSKETFRHPTLIISIKDSVMYLITIHFERNLELQGSILPSQPLRPKITNFLRTQSNGSSSIILLTKTNRY